MVEVVKEREFLAGAHKEQAPRVKMKSIFPALRLYEGTEAIE